MKTPREILMRRHQAVEPKLDRIRTQVLADELKRAARPGERNAASGFAVKLWCELIWPCRRAWTGLAAVWLALLIFHAASPRTAGQARLFVGVSAQQVRVALQERREWMTELTQFRMGETTGTTKPATPGLPGPRSEKAAGWRVI